MSKRVGSVIALAIVLAVAIGASALAQIQLPTRAHETLDFELRSLRDDITLYFGDPQELIRMDVRPRLTTQPRVIYSGQADAVLNVEDQEWDEWAAKKAAGGTSSDDEPYGQTWEIRLCPAGPTSFSVRSEKGKGNFDFTDFEARKIELWADGSDLEVGFKHQNPIEMESCGIYATGGTLLIQGLINARAKEILVAAPQAECRIELTGKASEGESAVTLQGPPASLELVLPKKVGMRIQGPAATVARCAASHMIQEGDVLVSRDYAKAKSRIQLVFAEDVPRLAVQWN